MPNHLVFSVTFFGKDDVAAVRVCFSLILPDPVVERILWLRIGRYEWIDDDDGARNIEFYKDGKNFFKCQGLDKDGHLLHEELDYQGRDGPKGPKSTFVTFGEQPNNGHPIVVSR